MDNLELDSPLLNQIEFNIQSLPNKYRDLLNFENIQPLIKILIFSFFSGPTTVLRFPSLTADEAIGFYCNRQFVGKGFKFVETMDNIDIEVITITQDNKEYL